MDQPQLLNVMECAALLRCAPQTLNNQRVRGDGPPFCRLGSRIVYRRESVLKWVEEHEVNSTTQADALDGRHA